MYAIRMRTTIILNDKLVAEAKRLAAIRHTTLSEIVNEALRERLARPPVWGPAKTFRMPVFQGEGSRLDTTPAELSRLSEEDELQTYRS